MSAAARGAAGMVALNSRAREVQHERLAVMQREMDEIAVGRLPSPSRSRFSTAAERRKEPAWK